MQLSSRFANWGLTVALVSATSLGFYLMLNTRDEVDGPRHFISAWMEPPAEKLAAGTHFKMHIKTIVLKECPYEVRWSLIADDNEEVLRMVEPVRQSPPLGLNEDVVHDHFIPAHVLPGHYRYISQIFDICPGRRVALSTQRPIDIIVK